ncbi:MAG: hypothetical protein Q8N28_01095 [bacterium]|nr:hypothetical protein [bacterium]
MAKNSFEGPKIQETSGEKESKISEESIIDKSIKEDKDLRAEFFELREKFKEGKISQEETKRIKERLEEINKKCEPISKDLNSKSEGFYSEIMDIPVRKGKRMSEKKWEDIVKKSGETLKKAEEKLGNMENVAPNIKKYLEERIKQKREQLGIREEAMEKPEKLEESKLEELKPKKKISPEEKIIEKAKKGKYLSKEDIELWQKIKSQKALKASEEMKSEIRELREKKQQGEILSEEEARRLEIFRLGLDIIQRSREEKKEASEASEAPKEKTLGEIQADLKYRRVNYIGAYTAHRLFGRKFGRKKEEDSEEFEKTIELAKQNLRLGDAEKLRIYDLAMPGSILTPLPPLPDYLPQSGDDQQTKTRLRVLESLKLEDRMKFLEGASADDRKEAFIKRFVSNGIRYEQAEMIYNSESAKLEYENSKLEIGKKMAEQSVPPAEIFKKLVLEERELLNQAKVESWPPKEKNIFKKGMEWYMKRGTATRLIISTGLITGVVASVGGFGAAAAATFAGYRFVRGFGSVMVGKLAGMGVDSVMSRSIEAQKEVALEKLKSGFDLNKLKETEKELEKIFEETAKKERRKLLVKAVASAMAGAGTAMGMGMLEQAWAGGGVKVSPEAIKPKVVVPESTSQVPESPAPATRVLPTEALPSAPQSTPEAPVEKPKTLFFGKDLDYQGEKSIWQEARKQWEGRFKEFADLGGNDSEAAEALKTYNIDRIKDTVAGVIKSGDKNLIEKYGLIGIDDPDKLTVKQLKGIKWGNIFEDTLKEEGLTENLSPERIENIVDNNKTFREFFKENSKAPRTSENYENILRGKGDTGIVSETPWKVVPETTSEIVFETPLPKAPTIPIDTENLLKQEVIPGDFKASYVVGFDQVFNKGKVVEGLKNMFGSDVFGEKGIKGVLIDRGDGVTVIKNAFGQKNFDLLLTDKTIAVDGPAGWNWGSKGAFLGFGNRIPTEKLSPETIKTAKNYILESVKEFSKKEALGH